MLQQLTSVSITVVGGDKRQLYLISGLLKHGATVTAFGFPEQSLPSGTKCGGDLAVAFAAADVVMLPMPGADANGRVNTTSGEPLQLSTNLLSRLSPKTPVLAGVAGPWLRKQADQLDFRLVEIADDDQLAVLNSIPTAEGALALAMAQSEITVHGSSALVLGFGRVAITMARMLKALGANTTVAARRSAALARATEMGCDVVNMNSLQHILPGMDFVFNTVPHLVLDAHLLDAVDTDTVVIDLASSPGGVDFDYAKKLGIDAILAPGLPGKVAPKTAGKILAQVVPRIIAEILP